MNKINYILFLIIYIIFFIFNYYFPLVSDDFSHYSSANNKNRRIFDVYFGWNGRIGEILSNEIIAKLFPTIYWIILNSFICTIFFFLIFYLSLYKLPKDLNDCILMFFLVGLNIKYTSFFANFLWRAGCMNYLWGFNICFVFLIPYVKYWNEILINDKKDLKNNKNIILIILFGLYAIPSGMFSEYGGICVSLLFLLLTIIIKFYKKIKIPFWYIYGIICFEVGYYFLMFSSGLKNRKKYMKTIKNYITIKEFLNLSLIEKFYLINEKILSRGCSNFLGFYLFLFSIFYLNEKKNKIIKSIYIKSIYIILLSFAIFIVINLKKKYNLKKYNSIVYIIIIYLSIDISFQNYNNLIYLFGILFYIISILLSFQIRFYAKRSGFISFNILNYLSLNILNKLINKSKIFHIISIYILISSLKFIIPNIFHIYNDSNEIDKIIFNNKKNGTYNIIIPRKLINNYNGLLDWATLTEDSKKFPNYSYNNYYNIKSIKVS